MLYQNPFHKFNWLQIAEKILNRAIGRKPSVFTLSLSETYEFYHY